MFGPVLTLPWGFAFFTVAVVVVEMIIGEIAWFSMDHLPEDAQNWADGNRFVIKEEE